MTAADPGSEPRPAVPTASAAPAQPASPDQPAAPARYHRGRRLTGRVLLYLGLAGFAAFLLLPFFWMVSSSLKANNEVFTIPVKWIPEVFHWENYVDIWTVQISAAASNMGSWLKNTMILSVVVTLLQLFTGSFAAYGFSRIRFPGRDTLFLAYIATIAVPWQAYMIPQYKLMSQVHLTDTLWSIIILQAFGAFGVFLMKQFYETIPEELSESARLDGLSEYGIYWRIMLPLSGPAIASLALLTFVRTWNDFLGPKLYLRSPQNYTIQVGLKLFQADPMGSSLYGLMFAGSVLSVLPVAVIFLLGQRYFVEGVATSGLKG
ncbi:MAG: carbohydrate ABC transporter permease [Propionibacteriaceae bacterium]|jgi:multiple sugar transport system permease protein|nr:carbohydrate ABC transporter permease [Propionibacteriaceae bacterium]